MKYASNLKAMAVGLALAASMWAGRGIAGEQFRALEGIPAEAMSRSDLAAVEAKSQGYALAALGPGGLLYTQTGRSDNPLVLVTLGESALAVLGPGGLLYTQSARDDDPTVLAQLFGPGSGQTFPLFIFGRRDNSALGVVGEGLVFFQPGRRGDPLSLSTLDGLENPDKAEPAAIGLLGAPGLIYTPTGRDDDPIELITLGGSGDTSFTPETSAIGVLGPGGLVYSNPERQNNPIALINLNGLLDSSSQGSNSLAILGPGGLLYNQQAGSNDPLALIQLANP
ncbi:MAG: hypothetical protein ACRERD_31020, partial [Candidatus Binatia bacterium]